MDGWMGDWKEGKLDRWGHCGWVDAWIMDGEISAF